MDNVLLVTIDSLRADHVGYHGYERDVTPNIDRLAGEGSRFMNAHAHAGSTQYSFHSILTGVTPFMYGGHNRVTEGQTLLSEVFRDAGYATGAFHCNLYVSEEFGYNRGWDEFFDSAPDESSTTKLRKWAKQNLDGKLLNVLKKGYDYLESSQGLNVGSYHVPADEMVDRAIEFIEAEDGPTFVWLHFMDVHHPFLPPEEYQREFRGEDELVSDRESVKLRRKFVEEPENVTDEEHQQFIDLYDAEIKFTDAEIGRLMETVDREWGEEYLMALTADHGDHFLDHGYFGGAHRRDVKTHVPLFVRGWDDDGEYDELVGLTDLPVTLADASGLEVPENFYGTSLRRLVFDGEWDREAVFGGWRGNDDEKHDHVRTDEWNLLVDTGQPDQLFDLSTPMADRENVIDDHPDVVADLREMLDEHRDVVEATRTDDVERPDMNEEVKERLRRLGYDE
jgi:arylsulfatase A-like enzyme